jgi:hypothetical protein
MEVGGEGNRRVQDDEQEANGGRGRSVHQGQASNGAVAAGRGGFNQGSNQGNHTFHGRGRQYGGYTRGWQRPYPRGYRYPGARVNGLPGCGGGRHGGQVQAASSQQTITSEVGNQRLHDTPSAVAAGGQSASGEPPVLDVFRAQKAGKANAVETDEKEKPFCFWCYKPGHSKQNCIAKLKCEICGSTEHLTGKCPILKQPRLLAHPCGYDVSGLGFYHIPHAPISTVKSDNRTALVTVQGGSLSIQQLVSELSRLIPEKWIWNVTQQDTNSFVVPFPSRGDLQ